jgi:hypothetical protein
MNSNSSTSSLRLGRMYLWASLNLISTVTFAQTMPPPAIRGAKTDNNYANTTEINKTKGASDAQVLAEIEGDYGIGDVVRIVITTPKPVTDPLANSGHNGSSSVKMSRPGIPTGLISPPIGNLPAPQQETTPPAYSNTNEQPTTTTPTANRTNPNGQFTPIANRPAPLQTTAAKPIVYEYYNSKGQRIPPPNTNAPNNNGQFTPIANRPVPQQTMTPPQYNNTNGKPKVESPTANRTNPNGQFTPIGNRPAPQQSTTAKPIVYEYYNAKGQRIPPPNSNTPNNNGQSTPIANRPAPQQTTTPPQYNNTPQQSITTTPNKSNVEVTMPNIVSKTPFSSTNYTASMNDKLDFTNVSQKEYAPEKEVVTNKSVSTTSEKTERVERTERAQSTRSERSSSSGSSRASKSSGFSFKDIFSGLGGSGLKSTKHRNMKSSKKYGCYRFN